MSMRCQIAGIAPRHRSRSGEVGIGRKGRSGSGRHQSDKQAEIQVSAQGLKPM